MYLRPYTIADTHFHLQCNDNISQSTMRVGQHFCKISAPVVLAHRAIKMLSVLTYFSLEV